MNQRQPDRDADYAYDLSIMRYGPYFHAATCTLRIPYRWNEPAAKAQWEKRGMVYDPKSHMYSIVIPNPLKNAWGVTERARQFYFDLYRALNPDVTPVVRQPIYIVEYYTLSDCTARVEIPAASRDEAIAQAKLRDNFDALIGCREK